MGNANPCLRCGACCAYFRVSFYWAEADDASPGSVPAGLTARLAPLRRVMRGTDKPNPRCAALLGEIGTTVRCCIHSRRPSVCREFSPSWEDGLNNPSCDAARARWGLPVLTPQDWDDPEQPTPGGHAPPRHAA